MSDSWYPSALAAQDNYQPVDNPWLPDVGQPLISAGSRQISQGVPAVNQFMGNLLAPRARDENSPVRYRTASPLVNITEQDIADATEAAMASSGGGLGIKAYHSSPHDFDKFDLSKIGTGEGAQVYGHGLYFAENPAVSGQGGQYWRQFKSRFDDPEIAAAEHLQRAGFDRNAAIAQSQKGIDEVMHAQKSGVLHPSVAGDYSDPVLIDSINRSLLRNRQEQHGLLASGKPVGPRTYEVDIKADPAHFLDWDKPLSDQPKAARDFAREHWHGDPSPKLTGENIYRAPGYIKPANTSAFFSEAGIPGIKYLDQQSRNPFFSSLTPAQMDARISSLKQDIASGGGNTPLLESKLADLERENARRRNLTHNYVVFNPGIIDILRKYGIAAAPTGALGALAAQDQYNQP